MHNSVKTIIAKSFRCFQRFGVDILPRHFYSEIPDIRKLKATESWRKPYDLSAINGNDIDFQLSNTREIIEAAEVDFTGSNIYQAAMEKNGEPGYGVIEADFLYAFIAAKKPPAIVQIGCGFSTAVILAAAEKAGYSPKLTCIEPYPNSYLKSLADSDTITLINKPVEEVPVERFSEFNIGDLFFVDSSHTLGPAGEVTRIVIDIMPRLSQGMYVHFHDIYFPYDYYGGILDNALFFAHETSLLMAFLTFNYRFEIFTCLSMLHYQKSDELKVLFPGYDPRISDFGITRIEGHYPSSIFLLVK